MSYCGICETTVEDWEEHKQSDNHIVKEFDFFDNEEKSIDFIFNHFHMASKIGAHIIFLILLEDYKERLSNENL